MPGFFTSHQIGELSKEAVRERAEHLTASTEDEPVEVIRIVCDLRARRMLCEWLANAPDDVLAFLEQHELKLTGEGDWIMHVDLEEPPAQPPVNPEPD